MATAARHFTRSARELAGRRKTRKRGKRKRPKKPERTPDILFPTQKVFCGWNSGRAMLTTRIIGRISLLLNRVPRAKSGSAEYKSKMDTKTKGQDKFKNILLIQIFAYVPRPLRRGGYTELTGSMTNLPHRPSVFSTKNNFRYLRSAAKPLSGALCHTVFQCGNPWIRNIAETKENPRERDGGSSPSKNISMSNFGRS